MRVIFRYRNKRTGQVHSEPRIFDLQTLVENPDASVLAPIDAACVAWGDRRAAEEGGPAEYWWERQP